MADESLGAVTPAITTPVAAPEATPAPEIPADQGSEAPEGAEPVKPEKTYSQKEHEEAISKRLTKESRRLEKIARAEVERDFYKRQLEESRHPQPSQTTPPSGEPQSTDFKDYESYMRALVRYELKQEQEQASKQAETRQQQRSAREYAEAASAKLKAGYEKYPDFEEVALADSDGDRTPIDKPMAAFIADSPIAAELAYYLGKNRDEAKKIYDLSPAGQFREMVKLESKLTAPPKPTNTPAPIVPNKGTSSGSKSMLDMSQDEFEKHRKARLARK